MNQKQRYRIEVRNRQLKVMAFIRKNGKANTQQIISHFNLVPSQISGIVGQLTKNGEITGTDSGQRTRNGNPITDYRLTEDIDKPPMEFAIEEDFPLGNIFQLRIPDFTKHASVTRQHVCTA